MLKSKPLPTILYLCGHSPHPQGAKTQYQDRTQWFAAHGYAVLSLDTLEFAEVEENEVTILVNGAERGDKINLEEARAAYNKAEAGLTQVSADDRQAQIKANQAFKRARARFQAAGGLV